MRWNSFVCLPTSRRSSGRTHILVGDALTVLGWMKAKEIAEIVTQVVLEPYDLRQEDQKVHFLRILKGYDEVLPWKKG